MGLDEITELLEPQNDSVQVAFENPQPIQEPVEKPKAAMKEKLLALFKLSFPVIAVVWLIVILVLCCILVNRIARRPAHCRSNRQVPKRSRAKTTKRSDAGNGNDQGNGSNRRR